MKTIRFLFLLFLCHVFFLSQSAWTKADEYTQEEQKVLFNAQELVKEKDYKKAIEALQRFVQENPTPYAAVYYVLGNAYYMAGDIDNAYKSFKKGLDTDPENKDICLNLAKTSYELKRFGEAGALLEKAFNLSDVSDPKLLYEAAGAYYQAEEFRKAKTALIRLKKLDHKPDTALSELLVHTLTALKEWNEAEKILLEHLRPAPLQAEYWRLLSQLRANRKNYNGAAAALEIACRIEAPTKERLTELAGYYLYLNVPAKALRCLEKAYESDPKIDELEKLYQVSLMARRSDKALAYLEKALAVEPTADRFMEMGKIYYDSAEWAKAADAFRECVKRAPERAEAHLFLAYCALEIDDEPLAETAFRKASSDPEYADEALAALSMIREPQGEAQDH